MFWNKLFSAQTPLPTSPSSCDDVPASPRLAMRLTDVWIAAAVTALVWGLLRLWCYPAAFPDESIGILSEQAGAWPRLSPRAPLWSGFGRWVASLGAEAMQARMQLAGHAALALSAGLLYRIVHRFVSKSLDQDAHPGWSPIVSRLAGIGSALYLVCCPPVWRAAQSPHPSVLGLLLAIAATDSLLWHADRRTLRSFLLWAAITGIGIVESPLVLLFLPAWTVFLLLLQWGLFADEDDLSDDPDGMATPWRWQGFAGIAVAAASAAVCIIYAVQTFDGTEGYALRGFTRRLHVLQFFGTDYLAELKGALPMFGWMIVVVGLLVPWGLALALARRVQNGEFGPMLGGLYAVAAAVTVAQVTRIESMQLWSLFPIATFRVGACLVSAMTFGLVAAAWLLEAERFSRCLGFRKRWDETEVPAIRRFTGFVAGIACLVVGFAMLATPGVMVAQRRDVADRAALGLLKDYAAAVVEDAGDSAWVVTDGVFDHALRLQAWQAGSRLQPVCILPGQQDWVLRAVERRLPDAESRALFSIGPQVMLREWSSSRPDQVRKTALQLGFDLWKGDAVSLSPRRTVFISAPGDSSGRDAGALMAIHRPFWNAFENRLAAIPKGVDAALAFHLRSVRNNIARVANEVGIQAQDEGQDDLAWEAYSAARRLNPANISARLNLWALSNRPNWDRNRHPGFEGLRAELKRLVSTLGASSVLGIVRLHGTIRTPEALTAFAAGQLGSGGRQEALAWVDAALRLNPESSKGASSLRTTAAGLKGFAGDAKGARESWLEILREKPADVRALLGLAALEAQESGLDAATPLIDRARKAGAPPLLCDPLHAALCLEAGDPAAARAILQPHVDQRVLDTTVWYLWGWAALSLDDAPGYEYAQARLGRLPNSRRLAESLASKASIRAGDLSSALQHAKAALAEEPANSGLLEEALRLCIALGDYEAAEPFAKRLLAIGTEQTLARYALGTQLLLKGDAAAAEPFLARSASTAPSAETLNNLACAQLRLNKLDEAHAAAKAAVELAPERPEVWDTVAEVALARGLFAEAEKAARQALRLTPDAPAAWLRVAEALAAGGNVAEARTCLDRSELHPAEGLAPDLLRRLESLRDSL